MSAEAPPLSRWRWVYYAAGTAMIGYGTWGQLFGEDTKPKRFGQLLVAAALGHDLVIAPLVLLLGIVARRVLHRRVRGTLQGAALVGFVLVLLAIPGIGRYGEKADNSSILPRDYTTGLMLALAVVGGVTLVMVATKLVRRRP